MRRELAGLRLPSEVLAERRATPSGRLPSQACCPRRWLGRDNSYPLYKRCALGLPVGLRHRYAALTRLDRTKGWGGPFRRIQHGCRLFALVRRPLERARQDSNLRPSA